jgi:4-amino-4-deoxy-L-arabinose transferase-like glycosyltransferase
MIVKIIAENKTLIIIFISALILRVILFLLNSPGILNDSHDYVIYSHGLFSLSSESFGVRTPVYPFFLFIIQKVFGNNNFTAVTGIQLLLGYITGLIFLKSLLLLRFRKSIIILSVSLFLFSPLILYDLLILSESISIFLIILLIYYLVNWNIYNRKKYTLLLSLVLTLLILTRPQFALLLPVFLIYLIYFAKDMNFTKNRLFPYTLIIIPIVISLAWMTLVYNAKGMFNYTTLAGYNLINHTGKFIEYAPGEYDQIKEIYIEKRDENLRTKGTSAYTIWEIREELQQTLNLDKPGLSKVLTSLSLDLILNHPLEYFKSVWASVNLSLVFPQEDFRILKYGDILKFLIPLYHLIVNFGIVTGFIIIFLKKEKRILKLFFLIVFANLISGSLFDYGANSRFFSTVYPLLFLFASIGISYIMDSDERNEPNKPADNYRRS